MLSAYLPNWQEMQKKSRSRDIAKRLFRIGKSLPNLGYPFGALKRIFLLIPSRKLHSAPELVQAASINASKAKSIPLAAITGNTRKRWKHYVFPARKLVAVEIALGQIIWIPSTDGAQFLSGASIPEKLKHRIP